MGHAWARGLGGPFAEGSAGLCSKFHPWGVERRGRAREAACRSRWTRIRGQGGIANDHDCDIFIQANGRAGVAFLSRGCSTGLEAVARGRSGVPATGCLAVLHWIGVCLSRCHTVHWIRVYLTLDRGLSLAGSGFVSCWIGVCLLLDRGLSLWIGVYHAGSGCVSCWIGVYLTRSYTGSGLVTRISQQQPVSVSNSPYQSAATRICYSLHI